MDKLNEESRRLMEIVDEVNGRISTLAASSEEIAASAAMVGDIANNLKEDFDAIASM